MSNMTVAAGRRSRWGLFIAPVLVLILAAAWSGFWFYAASQAEIAADAWRAQEAKAGRIYDCAKRSIAGFPQNCSARSNLVSASMLCPWLVAAHSARIRRIPSMMLAWFSSSEMNASSGPAIVEMSASFAFQAET